MNKKILKLFAHLFFIPVSSFFAFHLFTQFGNSLNTVVYLLTEDNYAIFLRFDTRATVIFFIFITWLACYILFEFIAFFSKNFEFKRTLTNFRYAPLVIFISSIFIVAIFNLAMIQYSKYEIRSYIFSKSEKIEKPEFRLYNNYRSWCGNGASAWENYLYFETASEGRNNENPYIRSRSLLMSNEVQDWINGGDMRFDDFLKESCRDKSEVIRSTAELLLKDSGENCETLVSPK